MTDVIILFITRASLGADSHCNVCVIYNNIILFNYNISIDALYNI